MRLRLLTTLVISTYSMLALADGSTSTQRQPMSRFYVRGNMLLPIDRKLEMYSSKFRLGGGIAVGAQVSKYLRAELEGVYLRLPIRKLSYKSHGDTR